MPPPTGWRLGKQSERCPCSGLPPATPGREGRCDRISRPAYALAADSLAGLGIPATAGFGVDYSGLHATDERIRLDTIPTVQAVYHSTVLTLLTAAGDP
ncbi:MAG TPA: hypothetical protein VGJ13_14335 [Pseudonocardiaceae bacterium]|jgi:acetylornithine deacetylase/succinyl-diaminopimelate desuccinylase-like protein